jgi:hypothetical protein
MNKKVQTATVEPVAPLDKKPSLWTVSIYMAADNNLKEECVWALTELLRVGQVPEIDVIAQFDSGDSINRYDFRKLQGTANSNGASNRQGAYSNVGSPSRSARIKLDSLAELILSKFISHRDNGHKIEEAFIKRESASDSEMIENFLCAAIARPASVSSERLSSVQVLTSSEPEVKPYHKPYNMVVMSGHAGGVIGGVLNTDHPSSALSIPGLKSILESIAKKLGSKIEILGMDSCLMSMAEVCYQLRDTVDYLVGAQGFELNTGWPYKNILAALQVNPTMEPKEFACAIVKEYIHYYSDYTIAGVSVDHAACDLGQYDGLREAVMNLAQTLQDKLSYPDVENAILLAHWRAQSYKSEQYVDLWDFCDLLEKGCNDAKVGEVCSKTKEAVEKFVLISCYSGAAFQHSHGLSVYFPWAKSDLDNDLPEYRELDFHIDTNWGAFLEEYGKKTQREIRGNLGKSNHKSGKRERLPMPLRAEAEANVRTNPAIQERGGDRRAVRVKNPPDHFYKYEDDCAGECCG